MSKTIGAAINAKTQWTIGNKKLRVSDLRGDRFRLWFDQTFNLSILDTK